MSATMIKPLVRSLVMTTAACAAIASAASCSSNQSPGNAPGAGDQGGAGVGSIGLAFTLPGGDTINSVTFALKDSGGNFVPLSVQNPGSVPTNNSQSIDFQIGGV